MTGEGPQVAAGERPAVSVLMSTHAGEKATNLEACLTSLNAQTHRPDEIVLVVDGPVDVAQDATIADFSRSEYVPLVVVRLPTNGGLARAMNEGSAHCTGPFIMRMDSDDLCLPDRLALQLGYAEAHPDIDVLSSWCEEFFEDGAPSRLKVSPCDHDSIGRALRWRNVLVHPTILIRSEILRAVGGYRPDYGKLEDYDLFVRLMMAGAKFHVLPKILVRVRSSTAQSGRRGGLRYITCEVRFRIECFRKGFLSLREFVLVTTLYTVFRLVSGSARQRLYRLARV